MIKICIIVKVNSNIHFLYLKSKVRFIWLQRIIESHRKYNGGEANSEEIVVQGIFFHLFRLKRNFVDVPILFT